MDYRRALLSDPNERSRRRRQIPRSAVLYGAMACVAIGGPLLGLTGFTLFSSATLLLVASPVLLFFSPLLLFAASVISVAFVGFGAAGAMALAGLWAIKRSFSFLNMQNKVGTAAPPPGDGRGMSHGSRWMELGAVSGSSSSSEQSHVEDEEYKATAKEHIANQNEVKEVDVE